MPALPLLGASSPTTGTQLMSALPLTALVAGPEMGGAAVVELSNVTLVVPVLDFLALLTLATDGRSALGGGVRPCVDGATMRHAAQVQAGIRALKPTNITWDRLTLSVYTGWGVNATNLAVVPQTPVPASVMHPCDTALAPAPAGSRQGSGGRESSRSPPVGIIVGCIVGGTSLLAIAAVLAVLWWKRRSKHDARCEVEHVPSSLLTSEACRSRLAHMRPGLRSIPS